MMAAGLAALLTVAPATLGGGGALSVSLGRVVAALVVCLMLAVVAAWLIKRGGGRIDGSIILTWRRLPIRRIAVIETRRISAHADICLFRCDGEEYLVLSSATAQRVLRRSPHGAGTQ